MQEVQVLSSETMAEGMDAGVLMNTCCAYGFFHGALNSVLEQMMPPYPSSAGIF